MECFRPSYFLQAVSWAVLRDPPQTFMGPIYTCRSSCKQQGEGRGQERKCLAKTQIFFYSPQKAAAGLLGFQTWENKTLSICSGWRPTSEHLPLTTLLQALPLPNPQAQGGGFMGLFSGPGDRRNWKGTPFTDATVLYQTPGMPQGLLSLALPHFSHH